MKKNNSIQCPQCHSVNIHFFKRKSTYICLDCENEWQSQPEMSLNKEKEHPIFKIFLSYGRDEYSDDARIIKEDLERRGHKVWFDDEQLRIGKDWEIYIENGLKECDKVVLLMTPHSMRRPSIENPNSTYGYCLNEIAKALEKNKIIIPILLVTLVDGPPTSICRIQYLDLRDSVPIAEFKYKYKERFKRLIQAIEEDKLDFEGGQMRLKKLLKPLAFESEISQHISKFTGRKWLLEIFEKWQKNVNTSQILWIKGGPGLGKSAFSSYLCHYNPNIYAYHICIRNHEDKSDARRAILSIAYQLSQHIPTYYEALQEINLEESCLSNPKTLFDNILIRPLNIITTPIPDEPKIVIIDGLDEAKKGNKNEIADIIAFEWKKLPKWIKLMVTSRPEKDLILKLKKIKPQIIDLNDYKNTLHNINDLEQYIIENMAEQGIKPNENVIKEVISKSEGMFLYIKILMDNLQKEGFDIQQLESVPFGLDTIYYKYFEERFPDLMIYDKLQRPFLELIYAAKSTISSYLIDKILKWKTKEKMDTIISLNSFIKERNGYFFPFHSTLGEFLTDSEIALEYYIDTNHGHKVFANYLWNIFIQTPSDEYEGLSDYLILYLPQHLINSGELESFSKLLKLLKNEKFLAEKYKRGYIYNVVDDFEQIFAVESNIPMRIQSSLENYLLSIPQRLQNSDSDSKLLIHPNYIGILFIELIHFFKVRNMPELSAKFFNPALTIFKTTKNRYRLAKTYLKYGILKKSQDDLEGAGEEYLKGIEILEEKSKGTDSPVDLSKHKPLLIELHINYVMTFILQCKFKKAEEILKRTNELAQEISEINNIHSYIENSYGWIDFHRGDYVSGLKHFLSALDISEKIGNVYWNMVMNYNIGETYIFLRDYDNAKIFLEKAKIIADKLKDPQKISWILFDEALIESVKINSSETKDFTNLILKNIEKLEQVEKVNPTIKETRYFIRPLLLKAKLFALLKQFSESDSLITKALQLIKKVNYPILELKVSELRAIIGLIEKNMNIIGDNIKNFQNSVKVLNVSNRMKDIEEIESLYHSNNYNQIEIQKILLNYIT
ncbi:MAG: toll/interleukin-1 receptor domain-containing protein [Candidatus Lokiarchaeota archaeon]|nr:toll/interleukin-1 receptor domain-containing protein [Candidatus Harpocratesius repetitus]